MPENASLIRQMIECCNTKNAEGLREVLSSDCRHTCPGSDFGAHKEGADVIVDYFQNKVFAAFKEVHFDIVHLYEDASQGTVVVEWESHLKPRSGKNYSNNGVFVIECSDGRICAVREYFDTQKSHENVN